MYLITHRTVAHPAITLVMTVLLFLLCSTRNAYAEEADDVANEETGDVAVEEADDVAVEEANAQRALTLYRTAELRYREGRFEEAVALLREALESHEYPPLYYNLGLALQELGRWREAIEAFRSFLESDVSSTERPRVEARIQLMERRIAEQESRPNDDDLSSDAPDESRSEAPLDVNPRGRRRSIRPWPWIVAGLGAMCMVAGIVTGALYEREMDIARDDPVQQVAWEAYERAGNYSIAANATLFTGGTIGLAGLIWGIVDLIRLRRDRLQARPARPDTAPYISSVIQPTMFERASR